MKRVLLSVLIICNWFTKLLQQNYHFFTKWLILFPVFAYFGLLVYYVLVRQIGESWHLEVVRVHAAALSVLVS